jgi:hypothetical protein
LEPAGGGEAATAAYTPGRKRRARPTKKSLRWT